MRLAAGLRDDSRGHPHGQEPQAAHATTDGPSGDPSGAATDDPDVMESEAPAASAATAAPGAIDLDNSTEGRIRAPPQRFRPRSSFASTPGWSQRKRPAQQGDAPFVKVKHEDEARGIIRCPSCKSGLQIGDGGCALQVCMRTDHPGGGWYYVCFHCREGLGTGRHCEKCPLENTRETREMVKRRRNSHARRNPIQID